MSKISTAVPRESLSRLVVSPLALTVLPDAQDVLPNCEQPVTERSGRVLVGNANLTDAGNAQAFALHHGADVRYCHSSERWLLWDGRRWCPDPTEKVVGLAKETLREILVAATRITDFDARKRLTAHGLKSEAEGRLRSMLSLARSEPGIGVTAQDLDHQPLLLNCLNGTVELKTGTLRAHRREDLLTKLAPVEYNPTAKRTEFTRFLNTVMAGNAELLGYLQRAIGYAITGSVKEDAIFFLFGSGANGKTTFLEAIRRVLGDYAGQVPITTLMMKTSDSGIPNDIAMLRGWRFVTSSETEEGQRLAASKIKYLTSNAPVQARFLHGEFFSFPPSHKIFMDTNHRPIVGRDDDGIWRRIKTISFAVTVPKHERDLQLSEKLAAESSGVLAWAVQGCLDWQADGLSEPKSVTHATQLYRDDMDTGTLFISECCEFDPGFSQSSGDLYAAYAKWCEDAGDKPESKKAFGNALGRQSGVTASRLSGSRGWEGIRIRPAD
jgi:putative DNA primase/helicase